MLKHTVYVDRNGVMDNTALIQSDNINARSLAANVAESDTIPTGAKFVAIVSSTTCYVRIGAAAAVPGDTTDGSASELLPAGVGIFRALVSARTTGTIASGSTALVVDDTAGFRPNDTVVVTGAGVAGADLTTTISSITQATKTLTLGAAASTSVTSTTVAASVTTIGVISPSTCVVTLAYYG